MPISPNMGLNVPVPTVTPGPQYAQDISSNFSVIDSHNHSPGSGSLVPFSGITADQDLSAGGYSIFNLKTATLNNLSVSPPLSGSLYMLGNNLFFKDGSGAFDVQVTNGAALAGAAGTISGLPTGTASASYLSGSGTFRFQSATNTAAQMDVGPIILRKTSASSNSITIAPNAGLASNYSLTLPASLPATNSLVQSDASGNLSFVSTSSVLPVGSIIQYSGSSAPTGWLLCNGQALDSVANPIYTALFGVIGTTYGGTGASNFLVPDTRGVFVRGQGSQTISGQTYTGTLGAKQVDNLESHNHGGTTGSGTVPVTVNQQNSPFNTPTAVLGNTNVVASGTLAGSGHTHTISASGSGTETHPANITLNYIIKI